MQNPSPRDIPALLVVLVIAVVIGGLGAYAIANSVGTLGIVLGWAFVAIAGFNLCTLPVLIGMCARQWWHGHGSLRERADNGSFWAAELLGLLGKRNANTPNP